jgi:hypothetical protein
MKRVFIFLTLLALFSINAFADIAGGHRTPKPTPAATVVPVATAQPTPEAGPQGHLAEYNGTIRIYFSREAGKDADVPVLEIRRSAVEKLMASNGEGLTMENLAENTGGSGISSAQTIVSGTLFSLAFILGGVWIFRSGGRSKTAAGIMLGVVLGAGTVVLANSPPDYVVKLTSRIFDKNTRAYGYARNNVKIRLVDEKEYASSVRNDVLLIVPKDDSEGSE